MTRRNGNRLLNGHELGDRTLSAESEGLRSLWGAVAALLVTAAMSLAAGLLAPRLPELRDPGFSAASAHVHQALLRTTRDAPVGVPIVAAVGSSTGLFGLDEQVVEKCLQPAHVRVLNLCAGGSYCVTNVRIMQHALQLRPRVLVWVVHPAMFTGSPCDEPPARLLLERDQFERPYSSGQRTLEVASLYRYFGCLQNRPRAVSSDLAVRYVHILRYNGLLRRQILAASRAALGDSDSWGRCSTPALHSAYTPPAGPQQPADNLPLAFPAYETRTDAALCAVAALGNEAAATVLLVRPPTRQRPSAHYAVVDAQIEGLCHSQGLRYLDLSETGADDWFAEDGTHMNRKGKTEFSRLLAAYIAEALAE